MARSRGYAERVNVLKKVLVHRIWKFVPVIERNGKIVRDHVLIAGRDEHHPEGSYYIEWYEGSRRRKQGVGGFDQVVMAARRKSIERNAHKAGIATAEVIAGDPYGFAHSKADRRLPKDATIDTYLAYIRANRSPGTYKAYRYTLDALFRSSFSKPFIDEATREDVLKFTAFCNERGYQSRTIYDKLVVVLQFLKQYGITRLITPSDWPRYVETIRPIYEPEEIRLLLQKATEKEAPPIKFFLGSGFRDKELRFLCWYDIDLRNSLARVTKKPRWNFFPKNYEERAVPLPSVLIEQLRKMKEERKALPSQLVFPNSNGNPMEDHLFIVKRVAHRAGLNCGQCITEHGHRCSEEASCMRFFLHKFRHTYATEHLRHGVDIRTLQAWLGHRDIKSTMIYLKGVQSKDALAKVNAGSLAAYLA
jgi:integrase/recombinase XerD